MIARLAAVIVNQNLLASLPRRPTGRRGREQKRPVRRGEDMGDVGILQPPPKLEKIDWLTNGGAHKRNPLHPFEGEGKHRINGNELNLDILVVAPAAQ